MDVPASSYFSLESLLAALAQSLAALESAFYKIPGLAAIVRYVRSSHRNDPGRSILELILFLFVVRTLLQSRTRADRSNDKHFIDFSEKEIDELVDEWVPEPLAAELTAEEQADLNAVPVIAGPNGPKPKLASTGKNAVNLASYNFTGLAGNEEIKAQAVDTLHKYGVGSCGPSGFYGTLDVHTSLEMLIADFLDTEASILYSQGFSTISSVIPAFCKRGDIIVADRGVNFAIQKGLQISRSTIRWFDHNDLRSLEEVLESVERERKKRGGRLSKRFIVTEGIFEKDGAMVDLPKLIDIKFKNKYRLILDESISFGTVGRTGRGLTELYNVPASKIDMLIGSVANGLCSAGGFCAGSKIVVDHQRINAPAFVFSASMPGLLATSASVAINILRSTPSILTALQENIFAARAILDKVDCITIPSHPASPIIHISIKTSSQPAMGSNAPLPPVLAIRSTSAASAWPTNSSSSRGHHHKSNPASALPRDASAWTWVAQVEEEERALQDVVEECLAQGVLITRAKGLRGQDAVVARPSIRLALTAALSKKETEKAVGVVKAACVKVLGKRR